MVVNTLRVKALNDINGDNCDGSAARVHLDDGACDDDGYDDCNVSY